MKRLTEQFKEILGKNKVESPFPEGVHLIPDLLKAIKQRDAYILGEDEIEDSSRGHRQYLAIRYHLREEQLKRAKETL